MKKLLLLIPLVLVLVALTMSIAGASVSYSDPALCVAGKWLIVDAANQAAVRVTVPQDVAYGNQQQGGCKTPGPAVPIIKVVRENRTDHVMTVWIDGDHASTPKVQVTYGRAKQTLPNFGQNMMFFFIVR